MPFHHRVDANILDALSVDETSGTSISVQESFVSKLAPIVQQYQHYKKEGMLCKVDFTTLEEYLLLLRAICQAMQVLGRRALIYLAAAVSDFYIPPGQLPEHKIQSSEGKLQLSLEMTPKMLKPLVKEWIPNAFIISFKLETDPALLIAKAKGALENYRHQMVIANLLHTRKREVYLVSPGMEEKLALTDEDLAAGKEIEEPLIARLVDFHSKTLSWWQIFPIRPELIVNKGQWSTETVINSFVAKLFGRFLWIFFLFVRDNVNPCLKSAKFDGSERLN